MSYKPQMISASSLPAIIRWIFGELTRIANTFTSEKANLNLPVTHASPPKPIVGDVKLADGSNWDPSDGAGVYFYNVSSNWEKIGSSVDLSSYATTASLSAYATTASLSSYATTASLSSYATTASLSSYATTSYVQSNFISGNDFSTGIKKFVSTTGTDAVATYKASQHEFTHGLTNGAGAATTPDLVEVELICTQAELDFSVGDVIVATGSHAHASESNNNERGISVIKDNTKIYINVAEDGVGLVVKPRMTPQAITGTTSVGQQIQITTNNGLQFGQARIKVAGYNDSALNGEFTVDFTASTYIKYTTSGFSSGNFSGSPTVQAIGNSAKIGDNDTNASNSHWDVRVRALLLNV